MNDRTHSEFEEALFYNYTVFLAIHQEQNPFATTINRTNTWHGLTDLWFIIQALQNYITTTLMPGNAFPLLPLSEMCVSVWVRGAVAGKMKNSAHNKVPI